MSIVFIGLGSNVERERNLVAAVDALGAVFGPPRLSPVYRNPAVGFRGEDFYNLVAELRTELPPRAVVEQLRAIEDRQERHRAGEGSGPRGLDLDLLLHGDSVPAAQELCLPHPDIDRYAFVLYPLAQLAGDRCHPLHGREYAAMWRDFRGRRPPMQRVSLDWNGQVEVLSC